MKTVSTEPASTLPGRIVAVLTALALLASACQPTPAPAAPPGTLRVLAVETFLADIAQNVAGDRAQVQALMPPGIDPHAFEPAPRDVARIADSQVLIANGAGLEEWLAETIANAGGRHTVIEAAAGLAGRDAREGEAAVMSPEDKSAALCAGLAGTAPAAEIGVGADAAGAVALHEPAETEAGQHHARAAELLQLKLIRDGAGSFGGFVLFDVAEAGEYVFAAAEGNLSVTGAGGARMAAEETLPLGCAGLNGAVLFDLGPGEYVVALSGLTAQTTPFLAGPAGVHSHHASGDPHFWLDPLLAVKYVENIRDGLIAADPDGRDVYTRNADAYIAQLHELDRWIAAQVAQVPAERRLIVTNHESFGYFADRYGFRIIGTIIPSVSTGATPSAQQMARLVDHIRETGATAIFLETGSNPQLAQQIAQETGLKVVPDLYTHSITAPGGNAPTYVDMLKHDAATIVEALK